MIKGLAVEWHMDGSCGHGTVIHDLDDDDPDLMTWGVGASVSL